MQQKLNINRQFKVSSEIELFSQKESIKLYSITDLDKGVVERDKL